MTDTLSLVRSTLRLSDLPRVHVVPEHRRMHFLPAIFGPRDMMRAEHYAYALLEQMTETYKGGFWQFVLIAPATPNGVVTGFLYPDGRDTFDVARGENFFEADGVSAILTGMIVTAFALTLAFEGCYRRNDAAGAEAIVARLDALKDYASTVLSPDDARVFWAAID